MAKKTGINKKLLNQMTASAMPEPMPKPMLHLSGKDAKAMHGMKPGAKVKMAVHGKLMNVGLSEYGPNKGTHEASVQIHKLKMMKGKMGGKGMGPGGMDPGTDTKPGSPQN